MTAALQNIKHSVGFAATLILAILITGCGSSNRSTLPSAGQFSGNWQLNMSPSDGDPSPKTQSGFLLQNGNTITGSWLVSDAPCSGVATVAGTASGSTVELTVTPVGMQVNLTGALQSGNAAMNGDYTAVATGCGGRQTAPQSGTWTANLVAPLNGNLNGTITSQRSGQTYSVSGQISQGPNVGSSNATLIGTLNFDGYCVSTVNIAGVISGTSIAINLVNADGSQAGQMSATTSLDGTSITGKYNVNAPASPCGVGDLGSVTFTL